MAVTEEDLRICEEAASTYVRRVLESGLTVRKCDETTTQLSFLELSSTAVPKEGIVDDNSIKSWFAEVRVPQPYPDLRNPCRLTSDEGQKIELRFQTTSAVSPSVVPISLMLMNQLRHRG